MFTPTEHRGKVRRLLLDMKWGGVTYHLAEDDEDYTDADGVTTRYSAGLVIDAGVPLDVMIRSSDAPAPSIPAMLHLEGLVDVPARVANGWDLGAARCRLWVWIEGTTRRILIIDGDIEDPEFGAAYEPVNCSLTDTRRENYQRFPPASARITTTTWPNLYGNSVEQFYPWIIGSPGDTETGAWGAPALVVDSMFTVLAGGRYIDFNEGSGEVTATLTGGDYTAATLADHISTQMQAVGAQAYVVSLSPGTGLWTIATNVGSTVDLLWSSGTNTANTAGGLIGADTGSDSGAAQSHTLANRASGSPRRVLIAGHKAGASATMHNADDDTEEGMVVTWEDDGLGRLVSTVDVENASTITADINGSYYSRTTGIHYRGALLEGGGDLIRWALEQTDAEVDRGSLEAIADSLNVYKFAGYIMADPSKRIDLMDWLREHVLRFLPVSLYEGPQGIGLVLWRWGAGPADSVLSIVIGENAERVGRIAYSPRADIRNEIRLGYAIDAKGRRSTRRYALTWDRTDADATFSRLCAESRQRYERPAWEETAAYIYDPATAARVCADIAAELAPRHITLEVMIEQQSGAHLRRGDVVEVTDSETHLASRRCFVMATPVEAGEWVRVSLRSLS